MTQILWDKLRELISNRIGFIIRQQDIQYFQRKIETRIAQTKYKNLEEYYHLLNSVSNKNDRFDSSQKHSSEKEWNILANIITNGESFFFRDRGQIDLLANEILPKIIADKREAYQKAELPFLTLKVWSAGCSTGEEVYSLAMLISELIPDPAQWNIVIIGTDINQSFLDIARQGVYKKWSFRLTDPLLKVKYFLPHKQNWQIKPHLRSMVTFYQDNLIDIENISHHNYGLDLVICRNVFIYFGLDSISKAIKKIASTLRPNGYLISGHAELQAINLDNFQPISFSESVVYQYLGENQANHDSQINSETTTKLEQQVINRVSLAQQEPNKLSLISEHISLADKPVTNPQFNKAKSELNSSKLQLDNIQILLDEGQYYQVIKQIKQLIKQQSDCKELYYLMAQAYANQGDLEEAQINCDHALEIDSMYIAPLLLLAQIAEEHNNHRTAKELLKRIIYLEPLSIAAYLDLGAIYRNENDLHRSKKMYQAAYDILQESPRNEKIDYQGQTKVDDLLNHIKSKL
ncbi:Methylase of chemotaxis methyl-accepting protein [Hyella patelloides LEGE 07179]|uniref:Methylase of chemotaxis methyl-accepting protein n=1 Tax=Hyella patelloides LEGE 07179 TaxID=945734 RepID=A0A563VKU4_9CYAN|nr:protein-glutamate O-methyltransferase CheR [Hyella patelloides]VEP12070.1 Methylase of chemotaxis methyl-accepting protein [Hyella patelloides LEGE 07179]